MAVKYEVTENGVERSGVLIATIDENGNAVSTEKKYNKYERYAQACINSNGGTDYTHKAKSGKVEYDVKFTLRVKKALSIICGVSIPMPNKKDGFKKSSYRGIIMANENKIKASNLLSKDEALMILEITK